MIPAGFMADVDIESEKYRWMGSARLDFYVCLPYSLVIQLPLCSALPFNPRTFYVLIFKTLQCQSNAFCFL